MILLFGPPGIGKTALINAWMERTELQEGNVCWIRAPKASRTESLLDFVERLAESAGSISSELSKDAGEVALRVSSTTASVAGNLANVSTGYSPTGAIREERTGVDFASESGEVKLADALRRGIRSWLHRPTRQWTPEIKPLLVVVIDRFEHYPTLVRFWLGRELLPALCSVRDDWSCVFLLTGSRSWAEGKQGEYWNVPAVARVDREIGPLLFQDCLAWVQALNQPNDLADIYYEESQGLPLRFAELLSSGLTVTDPDQGSPSLFASLSASERRWVEAACFQNDCTPESLGILLGGDEGKRAFVWLRERFQSFLEGNGGQVLRIREKYQEEVRSWMREKKALRWMHYQRQAAIYEQLRQKVPDLEARGILAQIAPVRFFNSEILESILSVDE